MRKDLNRKVVGLPELEGDSETKPEEGAVVKSTP